MFNWFRRQFGSESEQNLEEKQKLEQVEQESSARVAETVEEEKTTTNEEYLNWAKAAFENIQQRKTVVKDESQAIVEETSSIELVAETGKQTSETAAEAEAEIPESIGEEIQTAEVSTPDTDVPAWMRKSDGLEKLRETAIEEEEEQETSVTESSTGINFDEDFVWSAKVLADQGRTPENISEEEINWLKKLRQGLGKTRRGLINQLKAIVGQGPLNQEAVMQIEALLLQADVGVEATDYIIDTLQNKLKEESLPSAEAITNLKNILSEILDRPLAQLKNPDFVPEKDKLNVWLMTGVNGAGKTTTIGKLAHLAQKSGYSCLIAAADTFRAAAVEQVKVWGERTQTLVIANPGKNTDPAAVVFDGINAAKAKNAELLLIDTAGRLQNKKNLMEELAKIRRIIDKKAPDAQVESLLVLDATLGQNGLRQAEVFAEVAQLTGVVLTKLDGTAKGGVALAVSQQLNLPIRFIGAGEGLEDLRPFSSYEFIEALLNG